MDKKQKIIAIIVSAIVSILIAVTACLIGVRPGDIADMIPDSGYVDFADGGEQV